MSRKLILRTLNVDIPLAGTAVPITTTQILTSYIRISPDKDNTAGVFIGDSAVDNTYREIEPDDVPLEYWASTQGDYTHGPWFDLRDFYLDTDTSGNNVIVEYYEIG